MNQDSQPADPAASPPVVPLLPLFSYGTLRHPEVQLHLFGRTVKSEDAVLHGYRVVAGPDGYFFIEQDETTETAGELLFLTQEQVYRADQWEEVPLYVRSRVTVQLSNGDSVSAWAYFRPEMTGMLQQRVAHRFLIASFKPGDYILFGKFRNKRARVIRIFNDERGIPYIEVQPVPKGRKKNRIFGLYTIRHMTPEAILESQQLEAAERALVQRVAQRYFEGSRTLVGGRLALPIKMANGINNWAKAVFGAWVVAHTKKSLLTATMPKRQAELQKVLNAAKQDAKGRAPVPPDQVTKRFRVDLDDLPSGYPVDRMTKLLSSLPVTLDFTGKPYPHEGAYTAGYFNIESRILVLHLHGTLNPPSDVTDYQFRLGEMQTVLEHELRHMVQTLLGDALGKSILKDDWEVGSPHRSDPDHELLKKHPEDQYFLEPWEFHTWVGQAKDLFLNQVSFRPEYLKKLYSDEEVVLEPTRKEFNLFVGDPKPTPAGVQNQGVYTSPFFAALWRHDRKRWQRAVAELWQQLSSERNLVHKVAKRYLEATVPRYVYHWTKAKALPSILSRGLLPMPSPAAEGRVVWLSANPDKWREFVEKQHEAPGNEAVLLRIPASAIPDLQGLKQSPNTFVTNRRIPPSAIEVVTPKEAATAARFRRLAREVRIVIDRDATLVVRAKHHDTSIVGTFESTVSLYRIFDGEELVRLARSGRFTGGTYSVGSERAHGASWGENISEIIGWGNRQRGHRLGDDLFLAKIDASGRRFYHMTPEVEFQPEGDSLQPATMDVSKCSTGLGCSVVDVLFNDATFYRVDPGGQIEPLSDQELHSYMKARPQKDVDLRAVSRVMHSGTIYGVDVNVVLDQEAPDHELQPPSPYYRTWYVEVTRVPAEETVILKGAKTLELAVHKAKNLLKGTTADDWQGARPVSLLPKAAMDVWRKREQIWQQRARLQRTASGGVSTATNSFNTKPGKRVTLSANRQVTTEPFDGDDTFPPAIASYAVVEGWLTYKGRNGSEGIIVGKKSDLIKWAQEVDQWASNYPTDGSRRTPWSPDMGGAEKVAEAVRAAEGVLRVFGEAPEVKVWVSKDGRVQGDANSLGLNLVNVHKGTSSVMFLGTIKVPEHLAVAIHEAAHLGFANGGREVLKAIQEFKASGGENLTAYHSLAGDFEGVAESAVPYVYAPKKFKELAPTIYAAVAKWFKGAHVRYAGDSFASNPIGEVEAALW